MLVIDAGNLKKSYGDKEIINIGELKIYSGDKIGIVGRNGAGKSTLLNLLYGSVEPDGGYVKRYCPISYIRQFSDERLDEENRSTDKLASEFGINGKADQEAFSGGELTRIKIANAFASDSVLLFADEPGTNLDYKGVELLGQKLSKLETFLLITHDRYLLDSLCNKILEIEGGHVEFYPGNYSDYRNQKELEFAREMQEYEEYVEEKEGLEAAISNRKTRSSKVRKAPSRMGNSEARLHRRASNEKKEKLDRAAKGLETRLEKLDKKERPKLLPVITLDFSLTLPPGNKIVISADDLKIRYGEKVIFENAGFKLYNARKTAVWGENGSGKTTLLNLICRQAAETGNITANINGALLPEDAIFSGEIKFVPKVSIGYFDQLLRNLDLNKTVIENVMQDCVQTPAVARSILARLLIRGDEVFKKTGVLSGGERIKVSFAKLLVSKSNLLILDEPTNHLDMDSVEALERVLGEYQGTLVFVTHDRTFANKLADDILVVEDRRIKHFEGTLEEYEAKIKDGASPKSKGMKAENQPDPSSVR